MRLFSYVVARDYGFAPNPFGKSCTLATCKPQIRQSAAKGDWIIGLSARQDNPDLSIVYVMRVDNVVTYNEYWSDEQYSYKKPSRSGSLKQVFGDNIYHRIEPGGWQQVDSHHSLEDGSPNPRNIANDTQSEHVLIGDRFAYWGSRGPKVPSAFLNFNDCTIQVGRGHKNRFPSEFVDEFVAWFEAQQEQGYLGPPYRWGRQKAKWSKPPT
ncbi:hypothetical protein [Polaromonas sp. JS666]|uniref:Nmad2 family putative nucleotide modification protein n=1 Tax=Polaromonas sp. (strain JS666 / ATCC BAA-500) TaxID=296591 RepID=UPI0000536262|nr:hypothetical protein [Polaromonas sp. JS666]ABE46626.1 hypothetical protein Bpro_4747 [Polaromonas sp. JS666]